MIKNFVICIIFIMITGCTSVGELILNTAAGALGNMLDRRVEGQIDDNKIDKEKNNDCEDCKNDKR
jgi:hypothetical protein|tara:strand:+ start:153 stop:350 length:198 start_codon:yes stop_codon:yes gene_type:complete